MESKEQESGDTHDPALLRDLGEDLVLVREVVWDARVLLMLCGQRRVPSATHSMFSQPCPARNVGQGNRGGEGEEPGNALLFHCGFFFASLAFFLRDSLALCLNFSRWWIATRLLVSAQTRRRSSQLFFVLRCARLSGRGWACLLLRIRGMSGAEEGSSGKGGRGRQGEASLVVATSRSAAKHFAFCRRLQKRHIRRP